MTIVSLIAAAAMALIPFQPLRAGSIRDVDGFVVHETYEGKVEVLEPVDVKDSLGVVHRWLRVRSWIGVEVKERVPLYVAETLKPMTPGARAYVSNVYGADFQSGPPTRWMKLAYKADSRATGGIIGPKDRLSRPGGPAGGDRLYLPIDEDYLRLSHPALWASPGTTVRLSALDLSEERAAAPENLRAFAEKVLATMPPDSRVFVKMTIEVVGSSEKRSVTLVPPSVEKELARKGPFQTYPASIGKEGFAYGKAKITCASEAAFVALDAAERLAAEGIQDPTVSQAAAEWRFALGMPSAGFVERALEMGLDPVTFAEGIYLRPDLTKTSPEALDKIVAYMNDAGAELVRSLRRSPDPARFAARVEAIDKEMDRRLGDLGKTDSSTPQFKRFLMGVLFSNASKAVPSIDAAGTGDLDIQQYLLEEATRQFVNADQLAYAYRDLADNRCQAMDWTYAKRAVRRMRLYLDFLDAKAHTELQAADPAQAVPYEESVLDLACSGANVLNRIGDPSSVIAMREVANQGLLMADAAEAAFSQPGSNAAASSRNAVRFFKAMLTYDLSVTQLYARELEVATASLREAKAIRRLVAADPEFPTAAHLDDLDREIAVHEANLTVSLEARLLTEDSVGRLIGLIDEAPDDKKLCRIENALVGIKRADKPIPEPLRQRLSAILKDPKWTPAKPAFESVLQYARTVNAWQALEPCPYLAPALENAEATLRRANLGEGSLPLIHELASLNGAMPSTALGEATQYAKRHEYYMRMETQLQRAIEKRAGLKPIARRISARAVPAVSAEHVVRDATKSQCLIFYWTAYKGWPEFTPKASVDLLAQEMAHFGFRVEAIANASPEAMEDAILKRYDLGDDAQVLVFVIGHGAQTATVSPFVATHLTPFLSVGATPTSEQIATMVDLDSLGLLTSDWKSFSPNLLLVSFACDDSTIPPPMWSSPTATPLAKSDGAIEIERRAFEAPIRLQSRMKGILRFERDAPAEEVRWFVESLREAAAGKPVMSYLSDVLPKFAEKTKLRYVSVRTNAGEGGDIVFWAPKAGVAAR